MNPSQMKAARIERWVWILIYGGLLVLVFGLVVEDSDFHLGWTMVTGGAAAVAAGIFLIFLRSRMKVDNPKDA